VWTDDVWVVDSTPVECGRSRETARRSDLAGWAQYGYCASHDPGLLAARPGQTLIGDKNYCGRDFEAAIASARVTLLRPARKGEPAPPGARYFKPLRQVIESVNDTFKGQLDLEQHGGRGQRRGRPRPAARPRPDRRHLAQRLHRPAHPAIAHGL
jgi:hypothetical protein